MMTLIALNWIGTVSAIRTQRAEAEARISTNLANQALMFEERLNDELLQIDQTLRVLAHAWEADPAHFSLQSWRAHLVLLNRISPDIFVVDASGIVRDTTVAGGAGRSIEDRDFFRVLSDRAATDDRMFIGPSWRGVVIPQWHMNLSRALRHSDGSFAGVLVVGLRLAPIEASFRSANVGTQGLVALVGLTQGRVRVAIGPQPVAPDTSIADSEMLRAMQTQTDAVWIGPSAFDGVKRVHGFRRVGMHDLAVVVAADAAEVMPATRAWENAAYVFASGITVLLLCLAAILVYALRAANRREAALDRERTELAAANAELARAKARADDKTAQLEVTLAGMSDGLAMMDADLRLVEWNPRFSELTGVPASILRVGLPMEEILRAQALAGQFGPVDVETEVARRMAILRAGQFDSITQRPRPDGTIIELRRNRLPDGGFVTLYTDITARKQAENALREAQALAEAAARAMSRFVAIVSHEIRTPLNALLNGLTILAEARLPPAQQSVLAAARQSGDALHALINDVLEMSRMEAGQLTLRPSVFALRPLLQNTLDMFTCQAEERRISLRLSMTREVPEELYEDPGRLRQVLINLLSNAVKFATAGEVRLSAELSHGDSPRLHLAVRDRGPIISDEGRERLFEPFSRLDEADEAATLGTGLGLTICRHLVTLMQGEIGCSVWKIGSHDAGNEFWIRLPIKPRPNQGGEIRIPEPSHIILPRTRILLVEDIAANQIVTATLLRREGHLVDIASNGPEAITAVTSSPYDLVFMDIFMPGMSGLETTRQIRALPEPAASIPIVALTANVSPEDRAMCTAAGMNGLLRKPVALQEMLAALQQHVWPHRAIAPVLRPPAPVRQADSQALSSARLSELRSRLSNDVLVVLVEDCITDLSERCRSLETALQQHDAAQIGAQAHAMAGMAAEYGMALLELRLRALMARPDLELEPAAVVAAEIAAEIARAAAAFRQILRSELV